MREAALTRRGPYQKGIRRRQEIVDCAAHVFGRFGYSSGSLRQIAHEIGVTPAALTRYFESKEDLLLAVLDYWDLQTDQRFPPSLSGLDFFRQTAASIRYHTTHPGLIELFLTVTTEATNPDHPARKWAVRRYARIIRVAVDHLHVAATSGQITPMTDHEMETEARALYATMDGLQLQWLLDNSTDLVAAYDHYLDLTIARWRSRPSRQYG